MVEQPSVRRGVVLLWGFLASLVAATAVVAVAYDIAGVVHAKDGVDALLSAVLGVTVCASSLWLLVRIRRHMKAVV